MSTRRRRPTAADLEAIPEIDMGRARVVSRGLHPAQIAIRQECDAIKAMLLQKNRRYGNSALAPVRVFSRADVVEQLKVRLDDKLSRLMRGEGRETEDVVQDLIGYLILLRVAERQQRRGKP